MPNCSFNFGDMSFVGPRHDVPGYADQLKGDDREVLKLRQGITGPASLKYRDEEELLAKQSDPQTYNDTVIIGKPRLVCPLRPRLNCPLKIFCIDP